MTQLIELLDLITLCTIFALRYLVMREVNCLMWHS